MRRLHPAPDPLTPRRKRLCKPPFSLGPDVDRRLLVENTLVARERPFIHLPMTPQLSRPAARRVMMQWTAKHLPAQFVPVLTRPRQVLMPRLVDVLRGT